MMTNKKNRIFGTETRPRLVVFRSNRGIYAQIIDDKKGMTIVAALFKEIKNNDLSAKMVGKLIAEKALKNKISKVVFDRNGYKYHGQVKALADGAKEAGLIF